ncbi:NAD-P-binding protein [Neolentinus lepideus HHB14362 ss-1]|uniref:NAD-P-binding protein n=1 Tax=Neolentinus lepideus HHB14362 ss-1 TaxID=1314782 RepID=A0A165TL35_9AGAM|nr:NAD-P-binding protein [Neolentinus lepideus HHB14362 ss-1]
MSNKQQLVLVTGISAFIGSHVVAQLLEAGYRVRGTVREAKLQAFQGAYKKKYPGSNSMEIVAVNDIAKGDLRAALEGVDAVIHVASPLTGRAAAEQTLDDALEGTLNVLRQATTAGVNKVVVTASWGTTVTPGTDEAWSDITINQNSWGKVTREQALAKADDVMYVYLSSKILAERAAWEYAQAHPKLDLATINPPFVYGPWPSGLPVPPTNALGTNGFIYNLISGEPGRPLPYQQNPDYVDVRDVARAHVAALSVPPQKELYKKRFLVTPGVIFWSDAVKYLVEARPELKNRLPAVPEDYKKPGPIARVDTTPAREHLGITEYIPWQKTLEDAIDWLLEAEKSWKA